MEQRIAQFIEQYLKSLYFPRVGIMDMLEIIIITFLVYRIKEYKSLDAASGYFGSCSIYFDCSNASDAYDFMDCKAYGYCSSYGGGCGFSAGTAEGIRKAWRETAYLFYGAF